MDELKPCPFCGGKWKVDRWDANQWYGHCMCCNKYTAPYANYQDAVDAVNRRAAPENKPDIDRLEGLLDDIVLARLNPDEVIACANKLKRALTDLRNSAPENEPLTKADRIRSMSDEELAGFIQSNLPIFRTYGEQLDWLGQPYTRKPEGSAP